MCVCVFGGMGATWPSEPRGVRGKKSLKMFKIFIPEFAANAPNLKINWYIWETNLLLLFSLHLSIIMVVVVMAMEGGGGVAHLATALKELNVLNTLNLHSIVLDKEYI